MSSIKEVQQQHSETVELLNEGWFWRWEQHYKITRNKRWRNQLIIQKKKKVHQSAFVRIIFTTIHAAALQLFAKSNFFSISRWVWSICQIKGVFINSLIESINDTCYEFWMIYWLRKKTITTINRHKLF
jgi:hypothetical protein